MSVRITLATTARLLGQLRRDRRTLAMVFLVAPALLALFKFVFWREPQVLDRVGAPMIGVFPLIMMFLITSIAMPRERTGGTLERLMSLPLAKLDLLVVLERAGSVRPRGTQGMAYMRSEVEVLTWGPDRGNPTSIVARARLGIDRAASSAAWLALRGFSVRACLEEAIGVLWSRTKVKRRKAVVRWVSWPLAAMPCSCWSGGRSGDVIRTKSLRLIPGDLPGSSRWLVGPRTRNEG